MVSLLQGGVLQQGGVWADLGAGSGNFTRALCELLGADGLIYAVDRDRRAFDRLTTLAAERLPHCASIKPMLGDFTRPLELAELDGILMTNALHFVPNQADVLRRIGWCLRPGGWLLLVEYDVRGMLPWVPWAVPFERFQQVGIEAGFSTPTLVGMRRSPTSGIDMYAALATRRARQESEQQ
jgi:SAM-dependent methyltransferase